MKEVTDPALLEQLNAKEVTDPRILSLLNEGKTPAPPEQGGILSGIWQGIKNLGSGAAGLATMPARAPFQIFADVASLGQNPSQFVAQKGQELGEFAKGMIPMRQSIVDLFTGKVPSSEQVSREATEAAGGYAIGKYAAPGAIKTGKAVVRNLPGSAVELNEMAAGKIRGIPETVRPPAGAVEQAYGSLRAMQAPPVAMNATIGTIDRLLGKEASLGAPDRSFIRTLRGLKAKAQAGMSFEDIQNNIVDFGEKIGQVQANKGTKLGELKDLYAALHEDAASGTASRFGGQEQSAALAEKSQAWDAARGIARRNFAANDLTKMVEESGISTVGDGFTQVNTNRIVSKIEDMMKLAGQDKRAKLFVDSFRPGELQGIMDTLKAIGKEAPKIPAKAGTPVGSSQRFLAGSVGTIAGAGIGGATGYPWMGTALGGPAGIVASELIARAMMTPTGRALVRQAVTPTGTISPQGAALIGAFLKAEGESDWSWPEKMGGARSQPTSKVMNPTQ